MNPNDVMVVMLKDIILCWLGFTFISIVYISWYYIYDVSNVLLPPTCLYCGLPASLLMMICAWIPLTPSHQVENDHKWQYFCQIRHDKLYRGPPVFEICLFKASLTCDLVWEPITEHYSKNEGPTRFSIFVLICTQDTKKRILASFFDSPEKTRLTPV